MRIAALALVACLVPPAAARAAEPDTYIFDVLALQPFKGSFARLVSAKAAPDWVKAISVQGAGTAGPMRTVDVDGTPYRLDRVCRVGGSCAENRIDVLWAPRGARVWAALVEDGRPAVMLGDPKGAQARALEAATSSGAAASSPAAAAPSASAVAAVPPALSGPVATPSSSAPAPADNDAYIFDVLALQPYKGNFARLAKARVLPDWVRAISAQGAGTARPAKTVDIAGTPYRLDRVCKVGACSGNTLDVLWAPRGARVWAALVDDGKPPVLIGDPKGPQAEALADAAALPAAATPTPAEAAPAAPQK